MSNTIDLLVNGMLDADIPPAGQVLRSGLDCAQRIMLPQVVKMQDFYIQINCFNPFPFTSLPSVTNLNIPGISRAGSCIKQTLIQFSGGSYKYYALASLSYFELV